MMSPSPERATSSPFTKPKSQSVVPEPSRTISNTETTEELSTGNTSTTFGSSSSSSGNNNRSANNGSNNNGSLNNSFSNNGSSNSPAKMSNREGNAVRSSDRRPPDFYDSPENRNANSGGANDGQGAVKGGGGRQDLREDRQGGRRNSQGSDRPIAGSNTGNTNTGNNTGPTGYGPSGPNNTSGKSGGAASSSSQPQASDPTGGAGGSDGYGGAQEGPIKRLPATLPVDNTESLSKAKWDKMMQRGLHYFLTEQRDTFLRRVRRGIPPQHRWAVWKAAVSEQKGISPTIRESTYQNLVNKENKWFPLIRIDISRTFPETQEFGPEEQEKLLRILSAYSNFNMDVGYCQGMNFIAGLLLLVSGCNEIDTFWMFASLMELRGLKGFYKEGFPMLRVYLKAFDRLLDEELPELRNHFRNENVQPAVYLHQWFLTLYINCLPLETVLVIWDVVVCEGLHVLLNITLSLLKVLQSVLLKLEFEDIVKFFKTMKAGDEDCDATMIGQLLIRQSARIELSPHVLQIIESESGALANENADFDDFSDDGNRQGSSQHANGAQGQAGSNSDGKNGSYNNGSGSYSSGGANYGSGHGGPNGAGGYKYGPDGELSWFERVGRDIGSFFQDQPGGPGGPQHLGEGGPDGSGNRDGSRRERRDGGSSRKRGDGGGRP